MKKIFPYILATCSLATITSLSAAQDDINPNEKDIKKSQEIVIRKKGDKSEKMTIVVDGDKVTINGKPVDDMKDGDVKIYKREFGNNAPHFRAFSSPGKNVQIERLIDLMPAGVNKAMLGVLLAKADEGVKVTDVTKEGGAEKAGLKKDDIITKIGTTKVSDPKELTEAIGKYKPMDKVDITYKRNGKENKTTATLGENKAKRFSFRMNDDDFDFDMPEGLMPPMPPMPPHGDFNFNFNRKPKMGLQIQDLEEGKGVKVKDVDDDSPASKAGLKEGDVITGINGKDVAGVDELRNELKEIKEGDAVKMNYTRDGKNQTVEIKIPKRLKTVDL